MAWSGMGARRRGAWLAVAGLAAAMFVGCNGKPATSDRDIRELSYRKLVQLLDPETKDSLFTVLVDVRSPARYAKGHLPGAVNIPLPTIQPGDLRLAEAKTIVVYARGWTDPLSGPGAKRLMAMGYENVYDFRGGVELWQSEGGALETSPAPEPGGR